MNILLKKDTPYVWTEKQQTAFDRLKQMLIQAPVLSYPDFTKPFTIYTDASGIGLGAVLLPFSKWLIWCQIDHVTQIF